MVPRAPHRSPWGLRVRRRTLHPGTIPISGDPGTVDGDGDGGLARCAYQTVCSDGDWSRGSVQQC